SHRACSSVLTSTMPVIKSSLPPPTCFTSAISGSPMATRATLPSWITFCCPTPRAMTAPSGGTAAVARSTARRGRLPMTGRSVTSGGQKRHRSKERRSGQECPGRPDGDGDSVGDGLGPSAPAGFRREKPERCLGAARDGDVEEDDQGEGPAGGDARDEAGDGHQLDVAGA